MIREKEIAVEFLRMVASGDVENAFSLYVSANFKHHNPYFKKDISSLKTGMQEDAKQNPEKELIILRAMSDEEGVAVHSLIKQNPNDSGYILAHFFKFQRDKISELWDLAQEIPKEIINENGIV